MDPRLKTTALNDIINLKKKKNINNNLSISDENGQITKDPVHISNLFNNFFTSIGPTLSEKISLNNKCNKYLETKNTTN